MAHIKQDEIRKIIESQGAIQEGHFVLTNGRHSNIYVDKRRIYSYPNELAYWCKQLAQYFYDWASKHGIKIDAVVGPEQGGIVLSSWIAFILTQLQSSATRSFFAKKHLNPDGSKDFILDDFAQEEIKGKVVLVCDDIVTTGKSCKLVVDRVRAHKGNVIGVAILVNRGLVFPETLTVNSDQLFSLVDMVAAEYWSDDCPLCKKKIPINTDLGHGKSFLNEQSGKG